MDDAAQLCLALQESSLQSNKFIVILRLEQIAHQAESRYSGIGHVLVTENRLRWSVIIWNQSCASLLNSEDAKSQNI